MEDKDTLKEINDDLDNLIRDIANPEAIQKIWKILKKQKDIALDYQALSQIDEIQLEINPSGYAEFPLVLNYFTQRLHHDISAILRIAHGRENRFVFFCSFGSISHKEFHSDVRATYSIPTANTNAKVYLWDRAKKQVIYCQDFFDIKAQARLTPATEDELLHCALRQLSAYIMADLAAVVSQGLKKHVSADKDAELLLNVPKAWGNLPDGVSRGFYINPYDKEGEGAPRIYEYPKGKIMFDSEIREEWGLGFFCQNIIANALFNLGDSIASLLINSLKDKNIWVKQVAIGVLGALKNKECIDELINILEKEPFLYAETLSALAIIGDYRAYNYFLSALKSDSWPIRRVALMGLLRINDKKAIEPISDSLATEKIRGIRKMAKKIIKILRVGFPKRKNKLWALIRRSLSGEDEIDKFIDEIYGR